jgi:aspartate racemase
MDDLMRGMFEPDTAATYLQNVIERMKSRGCDAAVLGCTERPAILTESTSPLPALDSSRAVAALCRAVEQTSEDQRFP